ncbi:hypothetical protein BDN70DRAFT_512295 [Pholiota conissans]|uniref:Uncharacterized protein n=1 Tax=Pholiota conissans TaxID=109636 RepID=A0A9P5Z531_9AGAR|nr:hypothetical protein BDN70DRAFT_512295 [Pholiota conissans]
MSFSLLWSMSATTARRYSGADTSVISTGTWRLKQGTSSGICRYKATLSESKDNLSFKFNGTGIKLVGGINLMPKGAFAIYSIDGVVVKNAIGSLTAHTTSLGANNTILCIAHEENTF